MKVFRLFRQTTILWFIIAHQICIGQSVTLKETETIELGKKYSFYSDVLDEERQLWIRLPEAYDSEVDDYPVIYLLDGHFGFLYTAGLLEQLEFKNVPKSILVGVISTDRIRDFTPPRDEEWLKELYQKFFPTAGGADNFIKMFEEELFPLINSNFRTNEFKTLIGSSAGGIFTIYSLFAKPETFNAYLSISPELGIESKKFVNYFEQKLKANLDLKALFYVTMGNEEGAQQGGLMKLLSILETESPTNLRWGYKVHPNETHQSNLLISQLEGFEFFYKDWFVPNPVQEYLQHGYTSFELRSKRIKNEFNVDWELDNYQCLSIMRHLNSVKRFSESRDMGLSLYDNKKTCFLFLRTLADTYQSLGDKENARRYYSEAYIISPGDPGINKIINSLGINKHSLVPTINLSIEEFEKLTGDYVNSWNGNNISISFLRDTIVYTSPEGKFQLIPMTKSKAYFINSATTVEFFFGENIGNPASYYVLRHGDGEEIKCTRKN